MKTCKKCGAKLPEEAKFCHICGTPTATKEEEFVIDSDNLIEKVKEIIHEGNVTKITIKDEKDKVLLEIPVTIGFIGMLLVPWLAALGAIAALATRCKIIVEKKE
ncbi:MAG: DUF4342 domain-containing protein [Methanomicrobia archaeon]|jgi:uncharacterized membrane protein YvbJ|nr:DUF4342 domain-containing protein [Methanomicrobia archaeon]MCK4432947.1 DUF4342 domain-containing protein [Methanomicrobia archaeon]MCK4636972.1 DUF4342 domain-containing protein [Methanomicrobia archaeon]